MIRSNYPSNCQSGQGLVEFVVVATLILVPMMLALDYIQRLGDARAKAIEASRYAVWERTVWSPAGNGYHRKSADDIAREIDVRVFGLPTAPLNSVSDKGERDEVVALDYNLRHYRSDGDARPGIVVESEENHRIVTLTEQNGRPPGAVNGLINQAVGALSINENGFYRETVEVDLLIDRAIKAELEESLGEDKPLRLAVGSALLAESWAAAGPEDVKRVVKRSVPLGWLEDLGLDDIKDVLATLQFKEFDDLELGYVDPEQVPCERLAPGQRRDQCH